MNVALEIKAEAVRQRIPLKDLAQKICTNPERFTRAIKGEREFKTSELLKIATALQIAPSELIRRAENNN